MAGPIRRPGSWRDTSVKRCIKHGASREVPVNTWVSQDGQDLRATPAYTVTEAARYLSIPYPTLRSWFAGIEGHFKAVVRWEVAEDHRLSFSNLVEAHVLRALRTKYGISMANVRTAIRYVEQRESIDRLLLHPGLRAGLGRLFLKKYAELIELAPSTQHVIERAFDQYLEAVVQDPVGVPVRAPLGNGSTGGL
jgi:hypothetical protein